jgi:hypothetical protein
MNGLVKRYRSIIRIPSDFKLIKIKPFVPTPTEDDYKVGYIRRYFVQRANDKNGIIYEISENSFSTFTANTLYITTTVNWKISGTDEEIKKINDKVVRYASNNLPALRLYLPNLLQFSKNNLGE